MSDTSREAAADTQSGSDPDQRHPLSTLRDEFEDIFDRFASGWPMMGRWGSPMRRRVDDWSFTAPAVEVVDKDDSIEVRAEIPGVSEKDINVEATDKAITISGEKKQEHEEGEKGGRYYMSERRYGSFHRSLPIPDGIDAEKMAAKFSNGVLTVTMPKKPEARKKVKKIEIEAG